MAENEVMSPLYRRDDLFYRRFSKKLQRIEYLATNMRRRKTGAIPHLWAELWELLPMLERDKSRAKLGRWCKKKLIHLGRCINTRNKMMIHTDALIVELGKVYMAMRTSLFPLELKMEEEELSVRELLMERAMT